MEPELTEGLEISEDRLGWIDTDEPGDPVVARWRRPLIGVISAVAILSLVAVPVYNLIDRGSPQVAENGLEICAYDYCQIQESVLAAGLDLEMSRQSNLILDDAEAAALVDSAAEYLRISPIALRVEDELTGQLGGFFDSTSRSIVIERPVNAWIVLHEVAHAVAGGHGMDFVDVLIDLVRWKADIDG